MKQLKINVTKDNVSLVHPIPQITTGEYCVTQVSFDFSEEWNDKIKKARFGNIEVDIVNGTCYFPMFLKTGVVSIKVFGYDEEVIDGEAVKVFVYSPQPANIRVELGSYDGTAGGSSPVPPPKEDADYLTKSRLWNGYSMFFGTLTDVPQNIQDEYDSVDISVLTTAQVEAEIEKINNMLLDAQSVKYITVDTEQSGINKGLVNSVITVRTNGSLAGNGNVKTSATGTTAYIEVCKNTFTGLGTPMKTDRLQIFADRIVYGKGSGGAITEDKTVYFPNTDVSGQNIVKFLTSGDIPDISGLRSEIDQIWGEIDWFYEYTDELAEAIAECYRKPDDGIPKTDLASDVQTSLGKADTAIQIHQDISGKADISDIPTALSDLTDDLGNNPTHTHSQYLTSHQDISGKADIADVPTALSNLSDDSTHRTVTDAEKNAWGSVVASDKNGLPFTLTDSNGNAILTIDDNGNIRTMSFSSKNAPKIPFTSIANRYLTSTGVEGVYQWNDPTSPTPTLKVPWLIEQHRGYSSATVAENTMAAFKRTWLNGADMIELDARLSADNVYVCCHDASITVGGVEYIIAETNADVLTNLVLSTDSEYGDCKIPTVEEVLKFCAHTDMICNLDCKAINPETIAKLVNKCGMSGRVLYANTDDNSENITKALGILQYDKHASFLFRLISGAITKWETGLTNNPEVFERSWCWKDKAHTDTNVIASARAKGLKFLLNYESTDNIQDVFALQPDCIEFADETNFKPLCDEYLESLNF